MRLRENLTMGSTSTRVGIRGIGIALPFVTRPDGVDVPTTEDDPAIMARLDAIMSDHIVSCSRCGRDPHICQAIGCDPDDRPLLATRDA